VPNVLIVRGHLATPWELRPWRELSERFDVEFLHTRSNGFDVADLPLRAVPVRAIRDFLPKGSVGALATQLTGDRYLRDAEPAFAHADIVHAEELSFWFAADAARRKSRHSFKLVQTVWETLPLLVSYRNHRARRYRDQVLAATDLFLPATERAREALLLEGVADERIRVLAPGIDLARFRVAAPDSPPREHVVVSPGRLMWEKGHHDVLRAIAALHCGLVTRPDGSVARPRLRIVGSGPEESRLRDYATELGIGDVVGFGFVPYGDMPRVFAEASAMVLASQASAGAYLHPFDVPHAFWEEQFGLVLAEAMAAGLSIVTTTSGAIPEVVRGSAAALVAPGDWMGIARSLASGPLSRAPGARVEHGKELVQRFSTAAMAERLAAAYDEVLSSSPARPGR
jgi:glycosyltransferase involved in cell wall biosynthesis